MGTQSSSGILDKKKVVFSDLDGTVYLGNNLIPGAKNFLNHLRDKGIFYYFLSNNSSRSKKDYAKKLSGLGISAKEEQIILSTDGVIHYLCEKGVKEVYVIGTASMLDEFEKKGIIVDSKEPEYIILGYDTELTYEKLKKAALLMLEGVKLMATHCDIVCPTPEGPIPDVGAILALFEKSTGKRPHKIFGKPNADMINHIIKKHNVSTQEILMIGDRIYTDMELAHRVPCDSVLVLSGETKESDLKSLDKQPTFVVENIGRIIDR
jgi:HAD superfamily hydrolase (TIGR01450 family)